VLLFFNALSSLIYCCRWNTSNYYAHLRTHVQSPCDKKSPTLDNFFNVSSSRKRSLTFKPPAAAKKRKTASDHASEPASEEEDNDLEEVAAAEGESNANNSDSENFP